MLRKQGYRSQYQDLFVRMYPELCETGHQILATKTITFVLTEACPLRCSYCVTAGTMLLDGNFQEVPIEKVKIGDTIMGFDENNPMNRKQRKVFPSKVTAIFERDAEVIRISFDNGESLEITEEHPLLTDRGWKLAGKVSCANLVKSLTPNIKNTIPVDIDSLSYKTGYVVASWKGDGSVKRYTRTVGNTEGLDMFKIRLAVKDDEIIDRTERFSRNIGIEFYRKLYLVSKKYNMKKEALFANTRKVYNQLNNLFTENIGRNESVEYASGFLAGIYDTEGSISPKGIIRISQLEGEVLNEIQRCLSILKIPFVNEVFSGRGAHNIRIIEPSCEHTRTLNALRFIRQVRPSVARKGVSVFYNRSLLLETRIVKIEKVGNRKVYNVETDSHTYIANYMAVHNCYQCNKDHSAIMSKEVADKAIDTILSNEAMHGYMDSNQSPSVILDFIGGEPLLEAELMDYIVQQFRKKAYLLNHPWAKYHMISISSNGIPIISNPKAVEFIKKYKNKLSLTITIDGNKELHDACRVYPSGAGSYDDVRKAIDIARQYVTMTNTKVTLAPENVQYLTESVTHLFDLGFTDVHANCVFENVWKIENAQELYRQMIKLADIMIDGKLYEKYECSLFDDFIGHPMLDSDTQNWCGGSGQMLAIGTDGRLFPCIRFMKYSYSNQIREEYEVGDVDRGIDRKEDNKYLQILGTITRQAQSTDECLTCPVASGCSWCTGYNYDYFGTPNHRATFICWPHKARVLANHYYWSKLAEAGIIDTVPVLHLTDEDIKIVRGE